MSQENLEVVQAAYRALNEGDYERMLALTASDVEIEVSGLLFDQEEIFRGNEGARAYAESLREVWGDSVHTQPEQFIEQRERVVVMARTSARGKTSGVAVDASVAHIWTIRAGKVARFQSFASRTEALEAVGLSEQDAHADS